VKSAKVPLAAKTRARKWAIVLVASLALFSFSLNQGVPYAILNLGVILAMTYFTARAS
jgi:hypothetical protein